MDKYAIRKGKTTIYVTWDRLQDILGFVRYACSTVGPRAYLCRFHKATKYKIGLMLISHLDKNDKSLPRHQYRVINMPYSIFVFNIL